VSEYAMTIARSPDSTGHPMNIQIWFQSDPNVHRLNTNVLKNVLYSTHKVCLHLDI